MYTFCIEKNGVPLIKVLIVSDIVEKDSYLKGLVEKCFQRVFTMIKEEEKKEESSSEEADLEDDD